MCRATIVVLASNPKYLEAAINGAINQTYTDYKIIVRDDKQSDEIKQITETLMKSCEKLSYVRNEVNLKEIGSWFESLKSCDSEFLLAAHDDDILDPTIVEEQIKVFDMMKNVIQVTTYMTRINEKGQIFWEPECDSSIEVFKKHEFIHYLCENLNNPIACPTLMIRVSSVKKYVCDEAFVKTCADDLNRSLLLNNIGDICILHKSLCNYRIHANQASHLSKPSRWDTVDLIMPLMEQVCGYNKAMVFKCWAASRQNDCKIIHDIKDEFVQYLKSEKINPHNNLYYSFFMRIMYLQKMFKDKAVETVIWGAGGAGQVTFEMMQTFLPNFRIIGFIDTQKEGTMLGLPVFSPDNFDFKSDKFILVSIGGSSSFEVFSSLADTGLIMGENFIGGYGVSAYIDFHRNFGIYNT